MRIEFFEVWLLTRDLHPIRKIERFNGGTITGNLHSEIRWGATITLINPEITGPDWNQYRLQIMHVAHTPSGRVETPLGVFVVVGEKITDNTSEGGRETDLTLCDATILLKDSKTAGTETYTAASTVRQSVFSQLLTAGATRVNIAASDEKLRAPLTFEPGTSRLSIVNELLKAAGYFALYSAPNGDLRAEKYLPPAQRPIKYRFDPGIEAVHLPSQSWEEEISRVNEIVAISTSSKDTPALTAIARNQLPDSPYSYQNQGRWITEVLTGVEATSQKVLQEYANRQLEVKTAGKTFTRRVAFTPLSLNDVVAQGEKREVVENISLRLTPGELMEVTSREVFS